MSDAAIVTRRIAARASVPAATRAPVRYLVGAIAVFIAALMIAPVVLSFFASIKTSADAVAIPPTYLPQTLSLHLHASLSPVTTRSCQRPGFMHYAWEKLFPLIVPAASGGTISLWEKLFRADFQGRTARDARFTPQGGN